eukprot:4514092-Prorocentrum_lima.AAC.1
MVESWRPEHALNASELTFDEDGVDKKRRCPRCELDFRWEGSPEMEEKDRIANPNYCLWEQ